MFLKVPSHESYTQRRAPPRACLHQEEMPPFPLALGFIAAIPACSKGAVVTLLTLTRVCIGRTLSDAPHSLPFSHLFTLRQLHEERKRTANCASKP